MILKNTFTFRLEHFPEAYEEFSSEINEPQYFNNR